LNQLKYNPDGSFWVKILHIVNTLCVFASLRHQEGGKPLWVGGRGGDENVTM